MLILLLAQAVAPPPRAVPVSPPIVTSPRRPSIVSAEEAAANARTLVAVSLRVPDGLLWQGDLWVGPRGGASWRQSKTETPSERCQAPNWSGDSEQSEISITLNSTGVDGRGVSGIVAQVRWSRPASERCSGTRTVEIRATEVLPDRGVTVIRGDGGLQLELGRR